jgi:hypothetical protein
MPNAIDPDKRFIGDLAGHARFGDLVAQLGEPRGDQETDLVIMLARFLGDAEILTLATLIKRAADDAAQPSRETVALVAALVAEANPVRGPDGKVAGYSIVLGLSLARRVVDETGGRP